MILAVAVALTTIGGRGLPPAAGFPEPRLGGVIMRFMSEPVPEEALDRHLHRLRRWRNPAGADYSLDFIKQQFEREIARPHRQLGKLVDLWAELVPEPLLQHTRLEGFTRGVLRVAVDSSPHLYELNQLLRAGLERELIRRQPQGAALRRVRLRVAEGGSEPGGRK